MGTTRLSLLSSAAVGAALVYAGCDFCNGYDTPCGCTTEQQYDDPDPEEAPPNAA